MKVLAVEDESVARGVLRQALRHLGHEVVEANDGASGFKKWREHGLRVVVSDWIMPKMSGLDLCQKIRGQRGVEYTYFILVSAKAPNLENRHAAAEAGVDDFLTKPLDVEELWTRLRVAERILRYATQVRQLEELMPICSYCKKIRDDHNYWQQIESYINQRTGTEFSHSVCPDCYTSVLLPQLEKLREAAVVPEPPLP